jgi:enoyl-CoA hydratase/carnithine racemase
MTVQFENTAPVATITIDRPEKLNAMDRETYAALDEAFRAIDEDEGIAAAIVTGAGGRAFSAGADLKRMHAPDAKPKGWGPWRTDGWSFGRTPATPLIAAIDGYALAGGLELALTCDIRIATPESTFGCPEVRWALLHGLGAVRLPAVVGLSNAMSMLLTGDSIDAEEALRIGLISRIVPHEGLMDEARRLAASIAENHNGAVGMTKELANRAAYAGQEEVLRLYRAYFAVLESNPEQPEAIGRFGAKQAAAD